MLLQIMKENSFDGSVAEYFEHLRKNERKKYYDHDGV